MTVPLGRYCFTWVLVIATAILLIAGALVTSTGSGLAVPDWPLSYGQFMPKMEGGVLFEHGHRMVAGVVLLLTLAMTVSVWSLGGIVRKLSFFATALVFFQALLGGLTVLLKLPPQISIFHACTAQIFFCTTVLIAWEVSQKENHSTQMNCSKTLRVFALLTSCAFFLQLVMGAWMRHLGAGLAIPDFPTAFGKWIPPFTHLEIAVHFAHRVGALIVVLMSAFLVARVLKEMPNLKIILLSGILSLFLVTQFFLGALVIWMQKPVWLTPFHLLMGAFCLASSVLLTWQLWSTERRKSHDPILF